MMHNQHIPQDEPEGWREALEFYRDEWDAIPCGDEEGGKVVDLDIRPTRRLIADGGNRARAALTSSSAKPCAGDGEWIGHLITDKKTGTFVFVPAGQPVCPTDSCSVQPVYSGPSDQEREALAQSNRRLREGLEELAALVRGECPRLLDEDSGGNSGLDGRIDAALKDNGHG